MLESPQNAGQDPDAAARALIPAHALGLTDAAEAAAINALLARDPAAAAEFAAYAPLEAALRFAAPPITPPATLEARLRVATQPPARGALAAPQALPRPSAPRRGWRAWFAPATRPAWAVAGVALALLLATNFWWGGQARNLRTEQAAAATARATAEAAGAEYEQMLALLAAGQAQSTMLPGMDAGAAHAMLIWQPGATSGMVMAEQFPPLEAGRVYQVWLVRGDTRMSGGMFQVDETGAGMVMVNGPEPLEAFDAIGITPEPAGGSPGPTAPPVVRGTI